MTLIGKSVHSKSWRISSFGDNSRTMSIASVWPRCRLDRTRDEQLQKKHEHKSLPGSELAL
jgi:hypothetical protein